MAGLVGCHPRIVAPERDEHIAHMIEEGKMWVVCCISNPARYKTRYALYREFRRHVLEDLRLPLLTVEASIKHMDFKLSETKLENRDIESKGVHCNGVRFIDIRVRGDSWVWLKENLWNVGTQNLPLDCKYVLFCDADIRFSDRHAPHEIVTALQTHKVVQPWTSCVDLGPRDEVLQVHKSFMACVEEGLPWKFEKERSDGGHVKYVIPRKGGIANLFHPGYAIAWRRSALDRVGGLIESGIAGAGDHHMCAALIGQCDKSFPSGVHENYKKVIRDWQKRAEEVVRGDYGSVRGTILHYFHGPKANRKYVERWQLLVEHGYDPLSDVYKNTYGVTELKEDRVGLRDDLRRYLKQRDEDSTQAV